MSASAARSYASNAKSAFASAKRAANQGDTDRAWRKASEAIDDLAKAVDELASDVARAGRS